MNIGVFDSGLGGLSVFREIMTELPQYNYIYLGDNARVPYGGRSSDMIYQFTRDAVNFLFQNDCQLIIIACNTSSAIALQRLQQEYLPQNYRDRRILGVLYPVAEHIADENIQRVGIMATRATVASNRYPKQIKKLAPNTQIFQVACPLLTPMIEEDEMEWEGFDLLLQRYINPLLERKIDGLILGSTHYGLITDRVKKHVPGSVKIISQGEVTAKKLRKYLKRHPEIEMKLAKDSKRIYFATDLNQRFEKLTKLFLGERFSKGVTLHLANI
ncbi:MAG: glutamate racemase [Candidatus Levybacteria bacterium]|nr:glutamate racemase [Candidatus Levybacteria bacterium]